MDRAYLVTGGCGFIGEEIVELLSQRDYIKEVRVFDSVAREEVEKITANTENVLRACCVLSIPCVIYTSSIAAVGPNTSCEPMFRQRLQLSNGGKLTTRIIHANTMYGEKATFLQELYLLTTASNSVLNYLEPENTERNYTYVGNMAWMHVLATGTLQLKPDLLAGQVDYANADTPTKRSFLTRHQLLSSMDPSVRLDSHIPYWKTWLMIQVHRIIKVILYPLWKPQPFLTLPLLNMIVTTFSYETDKASRY